MKKTKTKEVTSIPAKVETKSLPDNFVLPEHQALVEATVADLLKTEGLTLRKIAACVWHLIDVGDDRKRPVDPV